MKALLLTFTLYLNKSIGIDVSPVHWRKVAWKALLSTLVLYLNKSIGIDVNSGHPAKV